LNVVCRNWTTLRMIRQKDAHAALAVVEKKDYSRL